MCYYCLVFFKQKTAYDMRISDWSSDVCSSDLQYNDHFEPFYLIASKATFGSLPAEDQKIIADVAQEMTLASMDAMQERDRRYLEALRDAGIEVVILSKEELEAFARIAREELGRASCRERVCQYVAISVGAL